MLDKDDLAPTPTTFTAGEAAVLITATTGLITALTAEQGLADAVFTTTAMTLDLVLHSEDFDNDAFIQKLQDWLTSVQTDLQA